MVIMMAILTITLIGVVALLKTPLWLRLAIIYYLFGSAWPIIKVINNGGLFYADQTLMLFLINHILVLFTFAVSSILLKKSPISPLSAAMILTREDISRIYVVFFVGAIPFFIAISWVLLKAPNMLIQMDFKNIRVDLFYNQPLPWIMAIVKNTLDPIANICFIYILSFWFHGVRKKSFLVMLIACIIFLLSDFRKGSIVFAMLAVVLVVAPPKGANLWSSKIITIYRKYLFNLKFIPIAVGGGGVLVFLFMQYGSSHSQLSYRIADRVFKTEMALTDIYVRENFPFKSFRPEYLPSVGKRIWGVEDLNAEKDLFFTHRPSLRGERYGNTPVLGLAAYVNTFGLIWGVVVTLFFFIVPVLIYKLFVNYTRSCHLVRAFEVAYCFTFLSIFATGSTRIFSIFMFASPKTIISLIVITYLYRIWRVLPPKKKLRSGFLYDFNTE